MRLVSNMFKSYYWIVVIICGLGYCYYPIFDRPFFSGESFNFLALDFEQVSQTWLGGDGIVDTVYRPLHNYFIVIFLHVFKLNALAWQMMMVSIHVVNSIIIGFIGLRLIKNWYPAIFYAFCPLVVEPTCCVGTCCTLFSCFFVLAGMLVALSQNTHRKWWVALLLIIGLGFKEDAVLLLPIAVIVLRKESLPAVLVFVAYMIFRKITIGFHIIDKFYIDKNIFDITHVMKSLWVSLHYLIAWFNVYLIVFFVIILLTILIRNKNELYKTTN